MVRKPSSSILEVGCKWGGFLKGEEQKWFNQRAALSPSIRKRRIIIEQMNHAKLPQW